jgi:single-stranded DNA-binding protein
MVPVNVVVLAGTITEVPIERQSAAGEELTDFKLSVREPGARLLPLPVVAWHKTVGKRTVKQVGKGDTVLVYGRLQRRYIPNGSGGGRAFMEVMAEGLKKLEVEQEAD